MTSVVTPAAELQDAVSAFLKAANHVLTGVEEANKVELRRVLQGERDAQHERDELRRERDALLLEKMNATVEIENGKSEVVRWKAATEKSEWMINHQAETIAQLRREAQQWKDQFIRVDEERQRLSARNDELVSQQLYANQRDSYYQEPLTPRSQGPQTLSTSTSASTRATSSHQYVSNGYITDGEAVGRRMSRGHPQAQAQVTRTKSARTPNGHGRPQAPLSAGASTSRPVSQSISASSAKATVVRRVHVVMDGAPIKQESADSEHLPTLGDDSVTRSSSIGEDEDVMPLKQSASKHRTAARGQRNGARRKWSEDKRIHDESDESGSDEDEDEYVPDSSSRMAAGGEGEEEEDELMLGGEGNRRELYGAEKVVVKPAGIALARRAQTQPVKQTGSVPGRKRGSPYPTNATGVDKKVRRR
ncbi:hypothetical protein M0805_001892 [Coniferiporia weirii]|nr:hypothetical protein M0805_001892 [Coniferiporia weirii]